MNPCALTSNYANYASFQTWSNYKYHVISQKKCLKVNKIKQYTIMSYVVQYNVHLFKFPFWKVSYFRKFFMEIDPKLEVVDIKEENVRIYRRYIVYWERSTWYFRKNCQNIDDISTIYQLGEINWRFCEKIAFGGNKSPIYRWLINNKLSIF